MDWVGASVIAPRPQTPIEFEVASLPGTHVGHFRDSMFYSVDDPAGYPRRLVRRWRYLDEESARSDPFCAADR
ncbi:MAG TPA: hypothetical protein VHC92_10610 [Rhodanobacteraceae bacterium]|jgi:hypothetical protein|nr:hypothetical protein [Rhodanobacteraceae bacterium]